MLWRLGVHVDEEAVNFDDPPEELQTFYDDISGALLDPRLVKEARGKELEFVSEFEVYRKSREGKQLGGAL